MLGAYEELPWGVDAANIAVRDEEDELDDESVEVRIADGRIPPVVGVAERLEDPILQELAAMIEDAGSVQLWYDQYLPPELGETHKDIMQALFGLEITPEEAAQRQEEATAAFYSR